MQGGYGPTGGDAMASARRLEDEVRVELRHAAHGCPMTVDADLTCEQPSILVTEIEKRKNCLYIFSLSAEIRNMSCQVEGSSRLATAPGLAIDSAAARWVAELRIGRRV